MSIIVFLVVGLLAGLLARAVFLGSQGMGLLATMLLGVVGSFVGGAIGTFIRSDGNFMAFTPSGLIWSTLGALIVLAIASIASRGARRI